MHNQLAEDLLEVLRKHSNKPQIFENYENPNFLVGITELLWGYYELEDEKVNDWIQGFWDM